MHEIKVHSEHEYLVQIGISWRDALEEIENRYEKVAILLPASLKEIVPLNSHHIFYLPDGEEQKSIETATQIWRFLGEANVGRKDAVVAIGGGATTDVGGFVAATWLRGVDWYALPTTLAAMVDASVGGKTGINNEFGKNLIGVFYSPKAVFIDLSFLDSLTDRDFSAGLAEVIKTGIISDLTILEDLSRVANIREARAIAEQLVSKSIGVKAKVVSADFKEGRLREILNFGHTMGHAIEKRKNYSLRHGEAVAIGLVYALRLSEASANLPDSVTTTVIEMLEKFGLPTRSDMDDFEALYSLMLGDKKSRSSHIRFIGISDLGSPIWLESVEKSLLQRTYERIFP